MGFEAEDRQFFFFPSSIFHVLLACSNLEVFELFFLGSQQKSQVVIVWGFLVLN